MSGNVAINRQTGEILVLNPAGEWAPATRARNPQTGEELFNDGAVWRPVPTPEAPRPPDEGMRQIGLGTRATVQGLAQVPGMVYDAAGGLINMSAAGLNVLGANIPRVRTARENVSSVADAVGLPQPATDGERMMGAAIEGAASIIPSMGAGAALQATNAAPAALNTFAQSSAARMLPEGARAALPAVAQTLTPNGPMARALLGPMQTQIAAGVGGGVAGQMAQDAGASVPVQVLANLAGGLTGAGLSETARTGGRLAAAMVQPFSEAGRQGIAGEALAAGSYSPGTLAARLQDGLTAPNARLPDSVPTTAQAARDPALMRTESSVRGGALGVQPQTIIGDADFARNASRTNALESMADGSTPDVRGAGVRDTLRTQRREVGDMVNAAYQSVDPEGAARFQVAGIQDALRASIARLYGPGTGGPPSQLAAVLDDLPGNVTLPRTSMDIATYRRAGTAPAEVDWRFLQNLRSRLGNIAGEAARQGDGRLASAAGKAWDEVEQVALQQRQPEAVQGLAERWSTAQAFRRQMGEMYDRAPTGAAASGNILRRDSFGNPMLPDERVPNTALRSVSDVRQVMQAAGPDLPRVRQQLQGQFIENLMQAARTSAEITNTAGNTGRRLSVAQFNRFMDDNNRIARELFEPQQYRQLSRIAADFAEGSRSATTGSTSNSQTAQNLSVANMIARSSNGLIGSNSATINPLLRPLQWLYRDTETMTRDLLSRALVDPEFALTLLAKAKPENIQQLVARIEMTSPELFRQAAQDATIRQTIRTAPGLSQPQE